MQITRWEKRLSSAAALSARPGAEVQIVPLDRRSDPDRWVRLHQAAFGLPRPWSPRRFAAEFPSGNDGEWLWMAFDRTTGEAVGAVGLSIDREDPTCGQIRWLMVDPQARRRQIARQLMAILETEALDQGLTRLVAETSSEWTEAIAFYQTQGFSEVRP